MKEPSEADREAATHLLTGFPKTIKLEGVEGYCVQCKAKRPMHMPEVIAMKNGKPAVKGSCLKCGANIYKIGMPTGSAEFLWSWQVPKPFIAIGRIVLDA